MNRLTDEDFDELYLMVQFAFPFKSGNTNGTHRNALFETIDRMELKQQRFEEKPEYLHSGREVASMWTPPETYIHDGFELGAL